MLKTYFFKPRFAKNAFVFEQTLSGKLHIGVAVLGYAVSLFIGKGN